MDREFYVVTKEKPVFFIDGYLFSIKGTISGGLTAPRVKANRKHLKSVSKFIGITKGRYLKNMFTPEYRRGVRISKERPWSIEEGENSLRLKLEPVTDLTKFKVYDSSGLIFNNKRLSDFKLNEGVTVKALIEARCSGGWGGGSVEGYLLLKGLQVLEDS